MVYRHRSELLRSLTIALIAMVSVFGLLSVPEHASAATIGTGAVSVKGPGSELVPGTTVEIRKDTCDGPAVWHTVTQSRPDAYGAFGIGLEPGKYCVVTLAAPAPYDRAANVVFTMEARPANWVTVWLPGPPPVVGGALVAKDESGSGVNGVTAYISRGACGGGGAGVWENTTASSRWSTGGFGISLSTGTYCATATYVPPGISQPTPVTVEVTAPGPAWITLWVTRIPYAGVGNDVLPLTFNSGEKIVEFSCPRCTGNTIVWAAGDDNTSDLLVNEIGAYSGKRVPGFTNYYSEVYNRFEITANAPWSLKVSDIATARQVWNSATGVGDDVVIVTAPGSIATVSNHPAAQSSYLGIWARDQAGYVDLIVNEVAPSPGGYWGRHSITTPAVLEISASGTWQIDVQ